MFGLFGTQGRVKTLFRIYKIAKDKLPNATEREWLEIVAEELIPPGSSTQIRNSGMPGKQYLDGVFESKPLDIDELIYHIVTLEFPQKYKPHEINIDEIREQNRTGKLSPRDKLRHMIGEQHKRFLQ
jgi:hypothetical protein